MGGSQLGGETDVLHADDLFTTMLGDGVPDRHAISGQM
jgi:hypothetical protein